MMFCSINGFYCCQSNGRYAHLTTVGTVTSDPVVNYRLNVGKYITAAETREM